MNRFSHPGKVDWIGVRPERLVEMNVLEKVFADPDSGLVGDRFNSKRSTKRQVTLIQGEHLEVIASLLRMDSLPPELLRRNIVVRGINLLALKEKQFRIGKAIFEMTGQAYPCSRMEDNLGPGGYNAVRGHGGITARVVEGGEISLNDLVIAL